MVIGSHPKAHSLKTKSKFLSFVTVTVKIIFIITLFNIKFIYIAHLKTTKVDQRALQVKIKQYK